MSQFVWIDYNDPEVGPWVGEAVIGGEGDYHFRSLNGGKDWEFGSTAIANAAEIRSCEQQFTVHYVNEDHPLYGEICARMMRAALTKGIE